MNVHAENMDVACINIQTGNENNITSTKNMPLTKH